MNLTVEFKNFKKIKDLKEEFHSGNVYIVGGPNNVGKTTFLQGIQTLATGVAKKGNNVSFGEADGQIKGQFEFKGANEGLYIVKWDFTNEDSKFVIIDSETNIHKSTSRNNVIAELFKYNMFTIDEWFGWGLTAEGRKKQAAIILNLLPEAARAEYDDIEKKVAPDTGSLYVRRTALNKEYDAAKLIVDTFALSQEQKDALTKEEAANNLLYQLKKDLEAVIACNKSTLEENKKRADEDLATALVDIDDVKEEISEIEEQMKALELKLKAKKDNLQFLEKSIPVLKEKIVKADEALNEVKNMKNPDEIRNRIKSGEDLLENIRSIKEKQKNYEEAKKTAVSKMSERDEINSEIEKLRERKKIIIEENDLPVSNIVVENGECFYVDGENLIPFTRDSVSYSEGGMIILRLMAYLNRTLPIWLVGSAESYDDTRMKELQEIAEKYDGIIFLDKVVPDTNEGLKINVIEK
jgi:KaiC/GvpD/RAD55 family RecA-like ATPase